MEPPTKRARLLDDSDSDSDSDSDAFAVKTETQSSSLTINEGFAKRFEHNKKREEKHRLEAKFGKSVKLAGEDEDDSNSSTSEEEDDAGDLATEALDAEISATLRAIRSKDPRVYDKNVTFYDSTTLDGANGAKAVSADKPMHLRDYHRKNLIEGYTGDEYAEETMSDAAPQTYVQEQQALKDSIIKEMNAAAEESSGGEGGRDDFLVVAPKKGPDTKGILSRPRPDVQSADKDPETFLTNFMEARAWIPSNGRSFQPLESDDSEDEARADAFEEAYNLRFENPEEANKTISTHSRAAVEKHSVRRDEQTGRQKARKREKDRKSQAKEDQLVERARLKTLIVDEMQDKAEKIREAANLKGEDFKIEEWVDLLNQDWDGRQWEDIIAKRFGAAYYADADEVEAAAGDDERAMRPKRPKWEDDISITDIVPDFETQDATRQYLSSEEEDNVVLGDSASETESMEGASEGEETAPQRRKDQKRQAAEIKRVARRDHRILSTAADKRLEEEAIISSASSRTQKTPGPSFRYRDTSPTSYGLTPLEILAASDAQLNSLVGLKKLYPFRDEQKKAKDKKRLLSKKGRLREWRKETFGNRKGPQAKPTADAPPSAEKVNRKKRRKLNKAAQDS